MPERKELPWYTQYLVSLLGKGKSIEGSAYSYNPESINIMYNMYSDEFGFKPSMVNRKNIVTKALPKEIASYVKTGDISNKYNPNGSVQNIAGIVNKKKNLFTTNPKNNYRLKMFFPKKKEFIDMMKSSGFKINDIGVHV